jgi:chloramphenicol O-acetyltransferase type A
MPYTIDLENWPRRTHFELYRHFDNPHFNVTANVDVEEMLRHTRQDKSATLTVAITYLLARAANQIVNFRWRIRGDQVVEFDTVHPSITILTPDNLFSFCTINFDPSFATFKVTARERIEHVLEHPTLEDGPEQDSLLFMTSIPWVAFTSFMHPVTTKPVDSVPRIAWGRIHQVEGRAMMPVSVQGHHALMDGLHVGQYFEVLEDSFSEIETLLS